MLAQASRLVLILPHLGMGGAQRVAVTLANHLAQQGVDVHVITTQAHKEDFYELSSAVKRKVLTKTRSRTAATSQDVGSEALRARQRQRLFDWMPRGRDYPTALGIFRGLVHLARRSYVTLIDLPRVALVFSNGRLLGRRPNMYLGLLRTAYWRVAALRELLKEMEPDVVVSFLGQTNILTIAAASDLQARLVVSERNDPIRQELAKPWQSLRPILYPLADIVTANSHGALEEMQRYCSAAKLAYLPNPVVVPNRNNARRTNAILFLARLVHQKGPDLLIDAFAEFVRENPKWRLQIAGDGPMRRELTERVHDYGIQNNVIFHGMVKDPIPLLLRSRIFVLPSRFEGTPNSLLEAMSSRLACIVTDASPGPLKLVEHGLSGLVVPNEDASGLAAAMQLLARDAKLRGTLVRGAWERVKEFQLENVVEDWTRLLFSPPHSVHRKCNVIN